MLNRLMATKYNAIVSHICSKVYIKLLKGGFHMIKIGLIAAKTAALRPEDAQKLAPSGVSIVPIIYSDPKEIINLYEQNHWFLDGIFFGGIYSQSIIEQHTTMRIPYTCLRVDDSDFLMALLKLASEGVSDFSRVVTDLYTSCRKFTHSLGQQNVPIGIRPIELDENAFSLSKSKFVELIEEGAVDVVISRFSAVEQDVTSRGGKFIYIPGSENSCRKGLLNLVTSIRNRQINNNLPAVGLICNKSIINEEGDNVVQQTKQLALALSSFNQSHSQCFMIHSVGVDCEVLTSNADLNKLTDGYHSCQLGDYLKEHLDFPIRIGWGVGKTMEEAYICASNAVVSEFDGNIISAVQTSSENAPMPLVKGNKKHVSISLNPHLRQIEGISPKNLSKIYDIITTRGQHILSAEEIAIYLEITKRSATRITATLVKEGIAVVSHKQQTKVKGRPAIVYRLNPEKFYS